MPFSLPGLLIDNCRPLLFPTPPPTDRDGSIFKTDYRIKQKLRSRCFRISPLPSFRLHLLWRFLLIPSSPVSDSRPVLPRRASCLLLTHHLWPWDTLFPQSLPHLRASAHPPERPQGPRPGHRRGHAVPHRCVALSVSSQDGELPEVPELSLSPTSRARQRGRGAVITQCAPNKWMKRFPLRVCARASWITIAERAIPLGKDRMR